MEAFLAYTFSLYGAILEPFGTPDFGPKLATGLLVLALAVFIFFLVFALPQAVRLRSALIAITGRSNEETEHEKRTTFQTNYETINKALASNKAIAAVWQEFRKTLIYRGDPQRPIVLASYLGLEEFVRDQLLREGLQANLTKRTGDGGADIVVRDELGKIIYLVQCKHTSEINLPIDAGLLLDAQRVLVNWQAPKAVVVGVSNAKRFAPRVVEGFNKISGRLIARDQLAKFRLISP